MFKTSETKEDIRPIRSGVENREIPSIVTPGIKRLIRYIRIPSIKNVPNPRVRTTNLSENLLKIGHNRAFANDRRDITRKAVPKLGRFIPPSVLVITKKMITSRIK